MLSAKSIENPTKSNLSNKNIELTHIKCWEVDGKFHIWCESSVTSSGLVLAFCFMVIKWLLQLQATLPHTTVNQEGKKDETARGAFFSCASLFLRGKICPQQSCPNISLARVDSHAHLRSTRNRISLGLSDWSPRRGSLISQIKSRLC